MTERRDLKGRVRDRQARTGESYVTALRQVLAQRPSRIPVIELFDLSALGARLGFTCRISAFPDLVERVDPRHMLERLRADLMKSDKDEELALMRAAALCGERPRFPARYGEALAEIAPFLARARAGREGVTTSGHLLAMELEGKRGAEMVLFSLQLVPHFVHVNRDPLLIIMPLDGLAADPIVSALAERLGDGVEP
jgi:hypothetical protein